MWHIEENSFTGDLCKEAVLGGAEEVQFEDPEKGTWTCVELLCSVLQPGREIV